MEGKKGKEPNLNSNSSKFKKRNSEDSLEITEDQFYVALGHEIRRKILIF